MCHGIVIVGTALRDDYDERGGVVHLCLNQVMRLKASDRKDNKGVPVAQSRTSSKKQTEPRGFYDMSL